MDTGMLWFDNDKREDLTAKVSRAADYYRKKYGQAPDTCFVHPSMIIVNGNGQPVKKIMAGRVEIHSTQMVLPNHFWIGVNGKN